jgi:putative DNA primase/helicase
LLGLVKFLTPYGLSVVHMTAAVLYRMIEKWGPTLIIDEADLVFKNDPEIAAIINSGWTRGQGVPRCRPRTLEPEIFDTFCPKAIGMIGLRVPKATLSRAIIVELQRKINDQEVIDFDHVDDAELAELRRKLLRWAMDNADRLTGHRPKNPDGFANRLTANWRMMLAISELGGHQLAKKARGAAVALSAREDEADAGGLLLEHCKLIFEKSGLDQIAPFKLIDELCDDEEWPWATWWQDRDPITPRALALMLKNYVIRSKKSCRRAYCRKDFEEAWKRYL